MAAGDVILIYQARGATISTGNTVTYGGITFYLNAGNYEFQSVASVSGNDIGLAPITGSSSCTAGALRRSYSVGAQVIRVPQYTALTLNNGASINTLAWNGDVGGIVAIRVQNALTFNANSTITVSGLGFRGGPVDGSDRVNGGTANLAFATDDNPAGGAKGEGIASTAGGSFGGVTLPFSSPGANFDIAAPANGGGGGGSHNGGGGGGANAASALTPYCTTGTSTYTSVATNLSATTAFTWCGQGVMPGAVTGAAAWTLDPGYRANGNTLTAHVGGGRGGYTYGQTNADALTVGPGTTTWTGDNRHPLGGWGGRPLQQDLANRVFFGGGGGAGANNSAGNTGTAGAPGGGIIFIDAGSIAGTGAILANGNTAGTSGNDAPGGGGAGGSIVVRGSGGGSVNFQANGGSGGNQNLGGPESEGPGGGGGGGIIAFNAGTRTANAGTGGTSNSNAVTEFPRNGATDGSAGLANETAPQLIFSGIQCAGLSISKASTPTGTITAGNTVTYTIVINNTGPAAANGSLLRDPPATGLSCSTVTCTSALNPGPTACAPTFVTAASVTVANLQGSGIPINSFPSNSTLTFQVACGVTATGEP